MFDSRRILIVGAGPTGLGAAWRLNELGHHNWLLVDSAPAAGGLSSSFVDEQGFTWDLGGHVHFSHYEYFDDVMDGLLGGDWLEHQRESWIWMRDRFIPYPLQNNIGRLPADELLECLNGLLTVFAAGARPVPANFEDWLLHAFGDGIFRVFLEPYNFKVWAYPPSKLNAQWVGERVATVDLRRVLKNIVHKTDDLGWGPNATFRFPKYGGTGAIWKSLAGKLPSERLRYNCELARLDVESRYALMRDGSRVPYDALISTIPLDRLLTEVISLETIPRDAHASFKHSSTHVVGVGFTGVAPEQLRTKCWMYFPEPNVPFYRATVFSNYSPYNVAKPYEQWSLMCEVAESPEKPVDSSTIVEDVVAGLKTTRFIDDSSEIVTRKHYRLEHGYPTPFLGRDAFVHQVNELLRRHDILSRGRFGAWKYEVSNQDHSFMQGVEAVDNVLFGTFETTFHSPSIVNSGKVSRNAYSRA